MSNSGHLWQYPGSSFRIVEKYSGIWRGQSNQLFGGQMMKPTHYAFTLAALLISQAATARDCSHLEAYAAETITDYLSSWHEIHNAFTSFGHCDSGGVAEGFDEAITKLWEKEWVRVPEMLHEFAGDRAFKAFIYRRIGTETVPEERWRSIVMQAKAACPVGAEEFCGKVSKSVGK